MVHSEQARQMFEQHYREMYRLAVTMLHDEDESRDVVGDVFVRVLERTSLLDTATARAFLLQSVRRRCVSELRRRSVRERVQRLLPLETDEDTPVPSAEDRAMLRRGVQALQPSVCRDIVLWHFRDGMKFREIAERLQVSETTVYKHLRRALDQLRVHFKKEKP
ncbi:MAG: sigma-70 family RNA polymerase sigma factor [Bacteroidales bacterium]|nr:sigma-70 family RNA polymerase sigma factor [Bacteroidales bacterium]